MYQGIVLVVVLSVLSSAISSVSPRIGCRDENDNIVDWFYAYKLPNKSERNESEPENSGLNYLFVTPDSTNDWTLSKKLISDPESMPGRTLKLMYEKNDDIMVMQYNDEPPTGQTDGTRGHTKGTVVANNISGFWLIHSVPHYPPAFSDKYDYPSTGMLYGQSFLCISLSGDQLYKVGKQLKYNEPHFYSSKVPDFLKSIYPEMVEALKMQTIKTPPYYNLETLKTHSGRNFVSFAKSRQFKKELYEDWVAPHLNAGDSYVETWRHGAGNIDSDCSKSNHVLNIEKISFGNKDIEFETMKDHSKWLVTEKQDWICVGDINRQKHQLERGGGTVCQQIPSIAKLYKDLIQNIEACPKADGNELPAMETNKTF